jgi:trans-2,3-dihydro-3-hydroxyanthranilate isomerase
MTELRYRIVDVFTDKPLTGNALCVVLDETPAELMPAIAREVNLSETTFPTLTGDASYDVRIFTASTELPFAGHPSLGTAWALGPGTWTQISPGATVTVEATVDGAVMSQPDPTFTEVDPAAASAALGLPHTADRAEVAEVGGIRHLLVATTTPLDALRPDISAIRSAAKAVRVTGVAAVRAVDSANLDVRVFVPDGGITEDPGTGSAAGPIGILARRIWQTEEDLVIRQGVDMGRPCRIDVHAELGAIRVGGRVAACAEGRFTI